MSTTDQRDVPGLRAAATERQTLMRVLEAMDDGVYIVDEQYNLEYVNRSLRASHGEPAGQKCYQYFHGRQAVCPWCKSEEAYSGDTLRWEWTSPHDGRHYSVLDLPLDNPDGTRSKLQILHDITPIKEDVRRLEEADRRKDQFLAILAHELRTPLTPMVNACQLLARARIRPEVQVQAREIIEQQVWVMARLIEDLLDASRVARGKVTLHRSRLDLRMVAESVLEDVRPILAEGGQHLSVVISEEPLFVRGDAVRLGQVLSNLLNNAIKFTGPGDAIALELRREGERGWLRLQDTGVGIAPDQLPHIFTMFRQGRAALEGSSRQGLGVGLALARSLVEAHGGTLKARSDGPGKGSVFEVELPLDARAATPRTEPRPETADPAVRRRQRVLVVEDNPDTAHSLDLLLSSEGYSVRVVTGGAAALSAATEMDPQAVLLDIGLPDINGLEVARRLREQPGGRKRVLVALTGFSGNDVELGGGRVFDAVLVKPPHPGDLERALNRPGDEEDDA